MWPRYFAHTPTREEVAELAMIPRTSAYKSLQSLSMQGFAQERTGAPPSIYPLDRRSFESRNA
jgi:sugar-specific transcriptional regulator TrmB